MFAGFSAARLQTSQTTAFHLRLELVGLCLLDQDYPVVSWFHFILSLRNISPTSAVVTGFWLLYFTSPRALCGLPVSLMERHL